MSTHNSKPVLAVKGVCFLLLLVLLLTLADSYLTPPETTARVLIHELYTQEEVDILFVGASRFRRGIDPYILDETLGGNVFMVSFGSQTPVDNYYLLKEAYKLYTPELVVLDVSYKAFSGEKELPPSGIILPQIKFSLDKLAYMKNAVTPEEYAETFFPVLAENSRIVYLDDEFDAGENYAEKRSETYLEYDYSYASNARSTYAGKGYLYNKSALEEGNVGRISNATWRRDTVDDVMLSFYEKALALCAEKGTQAVILDMPELYASIESQAGYDEYERFVSELAEKYQVPFFNLGFLKTKVFARKDSYFYDRKHLSYDGGQALSPVLGQILDEYRTGTLEAEKYFYSSHEEMLADNRRIFSTWMTYDEKKKTLSAKSSRGLDIIPEYQFLYKEGAKDDYQLLYNYGETSEIKIQEYTAGYIRVNCRQAGSNAAWEQYDEYKIS